MNPTQTNNQGQALDPSIVNLTKAIGLTESNGNYNAVGKNGEIGAYQFMPETWKSLAGKYLGDQNAPTSKENQDRVAYMHVQSLGQQGYRPSQVASIWNSGKPNPEGNVGVNSAGVAFDTPKYVKSVGDAYTQLMQGNQNPTVTPNDSTASGDNKNESIWGKAIDVAKGVGNFLFPIVGDVYHDIKGDSKKTFLQQVGDTALSALPFIPGLGEAGEAIRGGEAAAEGGAALAKGTGFLSKLAASPIAKGALTGYGAGVAGNLSQGQGLGESFVPNGNNLLGAALGAAIPGGSKILGSLRKTLSGIPPEAALAFSRDFTEKDIPLLEKYNDIARQRAAGEIMPSVENVAADNLDRAAQRVSDNAEKAGAEVGKAKIEFGDRPLGDLRGVGNEFWKNVQDKNGINIFTDSNGNVTLKKIPGSMIQNSKSELDRIKNIAQQLSDLHIGGNANVKKATEVIENLNKLVDLTNQDIYGHTNDPLEGLIKHTADNLNGVIRSSSPELAAANDRFSSIKRLQDEIRHMAGNRVQRGELLMKRMFTNNSADSLKLFEDLKNETGIDLKKHAIFAKNAVETYGGDADKSQLFNIIKGATQGKEGLVSSLVDFAGGKARGILANPESVAKNLLRGNKGGLLKSLGTKAAIEASRLK